MKKLLALSVALMMMLSLTSCDFLGELDVGELMEGLNELGEALEGLETLEGLDSLEDMLAGVTDPSDAGDSGEGMSGYDGDDAAALGNVTADNYQSLAKSIFGVDVKPEAGWSLEKAASPNKVNNLNISFAVPDGTDAKAVMKAYFDGTLALSGTVYSQEINWDTYKVSKGDAFSDFASFFAAEATASDTLASAIWIYDYNGKPVQFSFSLMYDTLELSMVLLG